MIGKILLEIQWLSMGDRKILLEIQWLSKANLHKSDTQQQQQWSVVTTYMADS